MSSNKPIEEYTTVYLYEKIKERFPNGLPLEEVSLFELGRLIGQQDVVHYVDTLVKSPEDDQSDFIVLE